MRKLNFSTFFPTHFTLLAMLTNILEIGPLCQNKELHSFLQEGWMCCFLERHQVFWGVNESCEATSLQSMMQNNDGKVGAVVPFNYLLLWSLKQWIGLLSNTHFYSAFKFWSSLFFSDVFLKFAFQVKKKLRVMQGLKRLHCNNNEPWVITIAHLKDQTSLTFGLWFSCECLFWGAFSCPWPK